MRVLVKKQTTGDLPLLISGFLAEEVGIPVPTDNELAAINLKPVAPGKSKADQHARQKQVDYATEGWWNSEKMLQQTDGVMDVMEHMFSNVQLAFIFDWSSGHHWYVRSILVIVSYTHKEPLFFFSQLKVSCKPNHQANLMIAFAWNFKLRKK